MVRVMAVASIFLALCETLPQLLYPLQFYCFSERQHDTLTALLLKLLRVTKGVGIKLHSVVLTNPLLGGYMNDVHLKVQEAKLWFFKRYIAAGRLNASVCTACGCGHYHWDWSHPLHQPFPRQAYWGPGDGLSSILLSAYDCRGYGLRICDSSARPAEEITPEQFQSQGLVYGLILRAFLRGKGRTQPPIRYGESHSEKPRAATTTRLGRPVIPQPKWTRRNWLNHLADRYASLDPKATAAQPPAWTDLLY
jgi:hypothetical protein